MGDRGDHELGDAVAATDAGWLASQVGEQDLHLAAVVRIDGAGRVEEGETLTERQAAPWTNLPLEAGGDGEGDAGRHQLTPPGGEDDVGSDGGEQIHPCRPGGHVTRQREQIWPTAEADDLDHELARRHPASTSLPSGSPLGSPSTVKASPPARNRRCATDTTSSFCTASMRAATSSMGTFRPK